MTVCLSVIERYHWYSFEGFEGSKMKQYIFTPRRMEATVNVTFLRFPHRTIAGKGTGSLLFQFLSRVVGALGAPPKLSPSNLPPDTFFPDLHDINKSFPRQPFPHNASGAAGPTTDVSSPLHSNQANVICLKCTLSVAPRPSNIDRSWDQGDSIKSTGRSVMSPPLRSTATKYQKA